MSTWSHFEALAEDSRFWQIWTQIDTVRIPFLKTSSWAHLSLRLRIPPGFCKECATGLKWIRKFEDAIKTMEVGISWKSKANAIDELQKANESTKHCFEVFGKHCAALQYFWPFWTTPSVDQICNHIATVMIPCLKNGIMCIFWSLVGVSQVLIKLATNSLLVCFLFWKQYLVQILDFGWRTQVLVSFGIHLLSCSD